MHGYVFIVIGMADEYQRYLVPVAIACGILVLIVLAVIGWSWMLRHRVQRRLRESEMWFRAIFDHANDAIVVMRDQVLVDCNEMTERMFLCSREELMGKTPFRFSPPVQPDGRTSKEKGMVKLRKALDGEPQIFEWTYLRADGSSFPAEVSLSAVHLRQEVYTVAIIRDISERKRDADRLNAMNMAMVGRETRMVELKREINKLRARQGKSAAYDTDTVDLDEVMAREKTLHVDDVEALALDKLLNVDAIEAILKDYCTSVGIAAAIIDLEGRVLISANWQRVCTDFHRRDKVTCNRCIESDTVLASQLKEGASYAVYTCRNGMTDAASPIIINGEHVANIFIGQFHLDAPDMDFFRKMADQYDFNREAYLNAVREAPIFREDQLPLILAFLVSVARASAIIGMDRLHLEARQRILSSQRLAAMNLLEDMRLGEEKLRTLASVVEQAPLGIAIADYDGTIRYVNECWARMHGYDSGERLVGESLRIFHTRKQMDTDVSAFLDVVFQKGIQHGEVGHKRRDGTEFPTMMTSAALRDAQGEIIGMMGFAEDISERKILEDRLRQSEKLESIGRLAGGVAHDFNNMLGGIMGAADLLGMSLSSENKKAHQMVGLIQQAAERAADLTSKLLAFSRQGKPMSTPMDMNTTIEDALALLERSLYKKIEIRTEFTAEKTIITGDPSQIQNAILNLGINARDAMPDGGVFTVKTKNVILEDAYCAASSFDLVPGEYIEIQLIDTGVGMDPDTQKRIFEPFFTTKGVGKGTGLGLAAVYGTVCMHKGALLVYSEIGKGTIFRMYLPITNKRGDDLQKISEPVPHGTGCILVIDDEDVIRTTAEMMLTNLGYDVLLAENGSQGVSRYEQHKDRIDLVILDMIMPVMNGVETFRAIRRMDPDAKIILASGFSPDEVVSNLRREGLAGFIGKPYRQTELARILKDTVLG